MRNTDSLRLGMNCGKDAEQSRPAMQFTKRLEPHERSRWQDFPPMELATTDRCGATATGLEKKVSRTVSFLSPSDGVDRMCVRNVPNLENVPLNGEALFQMGVVGSGDKA
jgi:hypothetical protein